jgi:hypothetical protein
VHEKRVAKILFGVFLLGEKLPIPLAVASL